MLKPRNVDLIIEELKKDEFKVPLNLYIVYENKSLLDIAKGFLTVYPEAKREINRVKYDSVDTKILRFEFASNLHYMSSLYSIIGSLFSESELEHMRTGFKNIYSFNEAFDALSHAAAKRLSVYEKSFSIDLKIATLIKNDSRKARLSSQSYRDDIFKQVFLTRTDAENYFNNYVHEMQESLDYKNRVATFLENFFDSNSSFIENVVKPNTKLSGTAISSFETILNDMDVQLRNLNTSIIKSENTSNSSLVSIESRQLWEEIVKTHYEKKLRRIYG